MRGDREQLLLADVVGRDSDVAFEKSMLDSCWGAGEWGERAFKSRAPGEQRPGSRKLVHCIEQQFWNLSCHMSSGK